MTSFYAPPQGDYVLALKGYSTLCHVTYVLGAQNLAWKLRLFQSTSNASTVAYRGPQISAICNTPIRKHTLDEWV